MKKNERLKKAIDYLRLQGMIINDKDVAVKMKADASNVSRSISAEPTDRFIKRFNDAFDGLFNLNWLLTGEGEMLRASVSQSAGDGNVQVGGNAGNINNNVNTSGTMDVAIREIAAAHTIMAKMQEQMDKLISVIDRLTESKEHGKD